MMKIKFEHNRKNKTKLDKKWTKNGCKVEKQLNKSDTNQVMSRSDVTGKRLIFFPRCSPLDRFVFLCVCLLKCSVPMEMDKNPGEHTGSFAKDRQTDGP